MRKTFFILVALVVAGAFTFSCAAPPETPPAGVPQAPTLADVFSDYRTQKPEVVHHIRVSDLPAPDLLGGVVAVGAFPHKRPQGAWPQVPPGFKVELFASGFHTARELRTAPNGDIFLANSGAGEVRVLHGTDGQSTVFADHLPRLYGMAFYPPGPDPQWFYVSTPTDVYRYPYHNGDLKATGPGEKIISWPGADKGHWTRDLAFSRDGKTLFVAVGSHSNVTDIDTDHDEQDRADVLAYNPDGSDKRVYVSGVRNAGGGIAVHPQSGELWGSVNERDALGDNLVPDYITHFQEGGFYGWPYYYMGDHPDPRFHDKHPELASKSLVPDVLIQPHNASLEMTFYRGQQFPAEYRGDIFSAQHGSWNRSVRTGYEVIRVPMRGKTRSDGDYEDFMTGFVSPNGDVWGRPVGVTVAQDGALLVSDDMSDSIWRVTWVGQK